MKRFPCRIGAKKCCRLSKIYTCNVTLRKTFSYFFLKQNQGDIVTLMKILNHSSQAVTLRYAGIEEEDIKAKLEDFDPFH